MSMVILVLAAILITGGILIAQEKKRSRQQDTSEKDDEVHKTESDEGLTQYTEYTLTRRQWMTAFMIAGSAGGVIGYLFYHHVIVALPCVGLGAMYPRFRRRALLHKRRSELSLQFKQALYSLSSSLAAGRSVENAFYEVVQDLQLLYPDANTDLIREFRIIRFRLENGEPIEEAVQDFSRRAGIEDITNFADVFTACKRTGGDLVEVVRRTSTMIGEKIDIQQEISVMVAQKKFESKVIMLAPVGFLAFLNMSAPDFMTPMYSGVGIIVSTFALFGLIACSVWILKIMDIRV
ncbi:pilus assembly protein TadB [Paenibacillus selenitireducens]|uniref:Pilus assembly protein TadB n=1 Tax=Paenibacillus selenitireducens TaxID=1324314 RepID=A0A1T2XAV4_9BACL|nr:type II secretion system F family protein [Paenibacillus selenitireducens]OPA76932.1 pilus assembly protein TadB [Paenibacillus selenitireducens]